MTENPVGVNGIDPARQRSIDHDRLTESVYIIQQRSGYRINNDRSASMPLPQKQKISEWVHHRTAGGFRSIGWGFGILGWWVDSLANRVNAIDPYGPLRLRDRPKLRIAARIPTKKLVVPIPARWT